MSFIKTKNKRLYTFIIALNDEYEGGETAFPYLNEKYKLNAGDALFFHTLDKLWIGYVRCFTWWATCKVREKWVCNFMGAQAPLLKN